MKDNSDSLTWLRGKFNHIPNYIDNIVLQIHVRAFILCLIGDAIFANRSVTRVNMIFLSLLANLNRIGEYSRVQSVLLGCTRSYAKHHQSL